MRFLYVIMLLACTGLTAQSQRLNRIIITGQGQQVVFSYLLDESVVVNISQDGSIVDWGVDLYADRQNDFVVRPLQKYNGRVEYYTPSDNEAFRGKIRYIGKYPITYYASFDDKMQAGKIKTLGNINFDYYLKFEDAMMQGKLRTVGQSTISYYSSFDNVGFKGKLRAVGPVQITYYSSFDDKAFSGKIKSINNSQIQYYSSFEPRMAGALKSGSWIQNHNGIMYWIRN